MDDHLAGRKESVGAVGEVGGPGVTVPAVNGYCVPSIRLDLRG